MLYQSRYINSDTKPIEREILDLPEIKKYVANCGEESEYGFLATDKTTRKKIGAVWLRSLKGYEYISDNIPELIIAIDYKYGGPIS